MTSKNYVKVGLWVYTSDGEKIGDVAEVSDGKFRVDASMQPDYWLNANDIATLGAERVVVAFPKEALMQHLVEEVQFT